MPQEGTNKYKHFGNVQYLTDRTYFNLRADSNRNLDINFKQSDIENDDGLMFSLIDYHSKSIFELGGKHYHDELFNATDNRLVSIYLRADSVKRVYTREYESMLQFFGDMGGLIEICFLTISLLVYLVIERNFMAAIISDTFKV